MRTSLATGGGSSPVFYLDKERSKIWILKQFKHWYQA